MIILSLYFSTESVFKDNLFQPPLRVHNKDTVIRDIYDGKFYKNLIDAGYFQNDGINLTCQLNSDGVSLFKSSTYSVWPVYLRINELPPLLRYLLFNFKVRVQDFF